MILVKYNKANVIKFSDFNLIPGINELTEKQWQEIENDSIQSLKIDEGTILNISSGKKQTSFADLPEAKAITMVSVTFDKTLLTKWFEKDSRPKVKKALKDQLKKIEVTDEKMSEEDEGEAA